MQNSPSLFTDSTGEGMAGATDVPFSTQNSLKTVYNGTTECRGGCGNVINPYESLLSDMCATCNRKAATTLKKNGMIQ